MTTHSSRRLFEILKSFNQGRRKEEKEYDFYDDDVGVLDKGLDKQGI